jgi:hypothetical protein
MLARPPLVTANVSRTDFLVEGMNILNCLLTYLLVLILQVDKVRWV